MNQAQNALSIRKINKVITLTMALTMIWALLLIAAVPYAPLCLTQKVVSKKPIAGKYLYTLSENLNVWSTVEFTVGDWVCLK